MKSKEVVSSSYLQQYLVAFERVILRILKHGFYHIKVKRLKIACTHHIKPAETTCRVWSHSLSPTQHRWTHLALTPAR